MKSSVEQINSVQCRVKVEIPAEEVDKAFDAVFERIKKKTRIQGFRPGRAPLHVIRKLYKDHAAHEVGENLINGHLFSVLEKETLQPIAAPVLEQADHADPGKAFSFSAIVDLMPKVEIEGYKGVAVNTPKYTVPEDRFEKEKRGLLRRQASSKNLDDSTAPAAKGHLVTIAHRAEKDGNAIPSMDVDNVQVALGFDELFAELENAILGMRAGESKDVSITLPQDYGDRELAGQDIKFHIELKEVQELALPAWDDEFAKDLGYETAAQLEENIKSHLDSQAESMTRQRLENAIMQHLAEKNTFDVPPAMVDQVIDSMIREMGWQEEGEIRQAMANQDLRLAMRDEAKRRTRNTLILWQVIQQEKLSASEEEVQEQIEKTMQMMGGMGQPANKQMAAMRRNLEKSTRENLLFSKAINFLIENAVVTHSEATL